MAVIHESLDSTNTLNAAEPTIKRLARRFFRQRDDREDAEQSARLALLEALPRFDPARGQLGAFIHRVTRNAMLDLQRSHRAQHRQADTLPDDAAANDGGAEDIVASLFANPAEYLTVRQAALIDLLFLADDRAELASLLGVSVDRANERVAGWPAIFGNWPAIEICKVSPPTP